MKTKRILSTPSNIWFQLFYGTILSLIILLCLERKEHYFEMMITIWFSITVMYYAIAALYIIPSSLRADVGDRIGSFIAPIVILFVGALMITVVMGRIWDLPTFISSGRRSDSIGALMESFPKWIIKAEQIGFALGAVFGLLSFSVSMFKPLKLERN